MRDWILMEADFSLFDGEAGGGAEGASTGQGGETAAVGRPGRKAGAFDGVLFGRQEAAASPAEGTEKAAEKREPEVQVTSDAAEERRRAFRELVNGEYKDLYTEETQRLIDRRFREVKGLEQRLERSQPIIDMLLQRYKIGDGDLGKLAQAVESDDAYWSQAAEEAGLSVEQYKQFQKLQRENEALLRAQRQRQGEERANAQLQKWYSEAEEVKAAYPSFDLNAEVKDPQFLSMLRSGVPVRHAYEVLHMEEIKAGIAAMQAKATEKQVVSGIRARGARPAENGTAGQSAFTVKDDVHKLTRKDRAEIARRAMRGETIRF